MYTMQIGTIIVRMTINIEQGQTGYSCRAADQMVAEKAFNLPLMNVRPI